jgi:hypothetical protein
VGGLPTHRPVSALHSHPKVPLRLLAALQQGLYRTENMGHTWRQVEIPVAGQVVAFAHHPEDPALLFAATDEGTILKSLDGGTQWIRQH